jgi:SSS family solute:Na+ symporter
MVDTVVLGVFTAIYLVVIMLLGYYGYKKTKKAEDFMLAGRRIHPAVLALSYGATFISTSAIVGFGGVAAQLGMGLIWLIVMNIGIGILLAFVVYGKRTREVGLRLRAVTFPDLLGKIFKSPFMQTVSGLIILVGMPLYTAAILIGGARFIESTLEVQYDLALLGFAIIVAVYVVLGGLIAVMYTDAVQGAIMFFGMIILIILTYSLLGGVTPANAELTAMAPLVPEGLANAGMTGWTSMPIPWSTIWITLITTITLGVGIGVLAQPQLVVRFMTVKDNRSLNRAVLVGGVFILVLTGAAYTVGSLTNVYFYNETGQIAVDYVGGNVDQVIPTFINMAMPEAFVIVFMLALLAAAMSTLSSLFHTLGTSAGYDIWNNLKTSRISKLWAREGEPVKQDPSGKESISSSFRATQVGMIIMIVISIALAYVMPGSIIARATAMFFGLCAAALLPAYTHGLFAKKPSALAAKASVAVGAISWFTWTAFVHVKESSVLGISEWLFGKEAVLNLPWQVVDPLIVALPLSVVSLLVIWFMETRGIAFSKGGAVENG